MFLIHAGIRNISCVSDTSTHLCYSITGSVHAVGKLIELITLRKVKKNMVVLVYMSKYKNYTIHCPIPLRV